MGALFRADRFSLGERGVGLTFGLICLVTVLIQGFIGKATAGRDPSPGQRRAPGATAEPMAQPLTPADLVILSLLLERPMHGYDVVEEYDRQEVKDWASVSKAQVYYALKKLAGSGHIAAEGAGAEPDPRGKTVFAVTPPGRAALAQALAQGAWVTDWRPQPLATWLGLSIHADPETRTGMVGRRRAFLLAELERERASHAYVQGLGTDRARVGVHVIALTIACIEAELAWLDGL